MKICFFSDIHGNGYSFFEFVKKIPEIAADRYIFGGDVFGYYYDEFEILDYLMVNPKIECILGNHDKMVLDAFEDKCLRENLIKKYGQSYSEKLLWNKLDPKYINFVKQWHDHIDIFDSDKKLGFFHGGPQDFLDERIYPDTIFQDDKEFSTYTHIFCGHTHHKMSRMICGHKFINPGSLGQQRDGKGCSYLVYDTKIDSVLVDTVSYDVEALKNRIMTNETDENMRERLIEVLYRKERGQNA